MNLFVSSRVAPSSDVDAFLRHRFLSLLLPDGDHLVLPFPARLLRVGGLLEGLLPGVLPGRGWTQHDDDDDLLLLSSFSSILLYSERAK